MSQVFMPDDPQIDDDVQFGVTRALIADLVRHDRPAPGRPEVPSPWYSVEHTFVVDEGRTELPVPPIK